jgi:hypothetical protein
MFSLFRLPLGAFQPHDVLYVFDRDGHIAGLLRVERESQRDEWTVVELDALGGLDAGDVRFRLVQHLLRDGANAGRRFHVACADRTTTWSCSCRRIARYGTKCCSVPQACRRRRCPTTARAAGSARRWPGRVALTRCTPL